MAGIRPVARDSPGAFQCREERTSRFLLPLSNRKQEEIVIGGGARGERQAHQQQERKTRAATAYGPQAHDRDTRRTGVFFQPGVHVPDERRSYF